MRSINTKIARLLLLLCCLSASLVQAHGFHVNDREEPHEHEENTGSGIQEPITFEFSKIGITSDPSGLFTDDELAEGGSTVQPSIWSATFPVDGGEVTLSILVDRWCGAHECPFRFRLKSNQGGVVLNSHLGRNYGMICQDVDSMTVDPIDLTVTACGTVIDLKQAR